MNIKAAIRPIGIITISLFGFLVIVSFYTDKSAFEISGKEMHAKVLSTTYVIEEDNLTDLKDVSVVDLRDSKSFLLAPRAGAINIPLASVLSEENEAFFKNDKSKVLVCNDPAKAHEVWMLLTQLGYENLYVLKEKPVDAQQVNTEVTLPITQQKEAMGGH